MCGKRLRKSSLSLVLFFLLFSLPLSFSCYADVTLTDAEANELMSLIQESKKDLTELQTQLEDVKNDYNEQKISYETQLKEAKKKENGAKAVAVTTSATTAVLAVILLVLLL